MSSISAIRLKRAECQLESALWEIINEYKEKKATKCEAKLNRIAILHVLAGMSARVATEIQWGNK